MSNSFFNNTTTLVPLAKARASDVESKFNLVEDGFDGVEAALGLKANAANATLTGTPTAPTATPGTNTTQLATTAFVIQQAYSSTLPDQTGNNGKFLKTNGSTVSWDVTGAGTGSVTSVAMSVPAFLSVAGSPVTAAGTLAVDFSGSALPAANGGTGNISYTVGDILYASGATALSKLAGVATGNALISGGVGVAPSWGKISLGGAQHVTGTLPVGNGGTGAITLTGIVKGNGTSAFTAATANTDYLVPALANTALTGIKTATFNSQPSLSTTTGSVTIDWTAAQNYKQNEPTGTITYTFTAPPGVCHLQLIIDSDGTSTAQTINWPGTVIWMGQTWSGANNKKSIINFWYDGTNYYAMGVNQA